MCGMKQARTEILQRSDPRKIRHAVPPDAERDGVLFFGKVDSGKEILMR